MLIRSLSGSFLHAYLQKQRYQSNSSPKTPWQIFCRHMHYRDIKIHRSYKKEIRAGIKQFHQDYSAVEAWLQDVDNFE